MCPTESDDPSIPPTAPAPAASSDAETAAEPPPQQNGGSVSLLTRMRQATGTVYGDIGTSVLYTVSELLRETVVLKTPGHSREAAAALIASGSALITREEALGSLSLVYWALVFVSIKYDLFVMRADNRGEGGTFALWSLLTHATGKVLGLGFLGYLVVAAAGLLAADGIITPPISMLGAYEPLGHSWAVIATVISLFILFRQQWRGTSRVGGAFGWFMMLVWFPWIAIKGIPWIIQHPDVFLAVDPRYAFHFLAAFPTTGLFLILGLAVLTITGGEAKYADIGHFTRHSQRDVPEGQSIDPADSGRIPVMLSWFSLVLPCLVLNYAGQVAYVLARGLPSGGNTYYALTPQFGLATLDHSLHVVDMVISAIAAFIASQALITGLFSIAKQAIALGFSPRAAVRFTSAETEGQVYIPSVNWAMFLGCLSVTLIFQTAGNLASAYGIAVTGSMVITTIVFCFVTHYRWHWPLWKTIVILLPILLVDVVLFASNLLKFSHGGYFPVAVAAFLVLIMLTWQWGRAQFANAFYEFGVKEGKRMRWLTTLRDMLDETQLSIQENLPLAKALVQGRRRLVESDRALVFLCSRPIRSTDDYVPVTTRVFLKKFGVLPAHLTFFHVNQISVALADRSRRYEVIELGHNIISITATYGYLEQPDIRGALKELRRRGEIAIPSERWIIEVGEEEILLAQSLPFFTRFRAQLFRWILRVSTPAHKYLGLGFDAGVSKELIPIVIGPDGVKVKLPELEIEPERFPPLATGSHEPHPL